MWLPSQQCRCPKALTWKPHAHGRCSVPQPHPRQPVAAARPAAPAAAAARVPRLRQQSVEVTLTLLRSRLGGLAPVHSTHLQEPAMLPQAGPACVRRHKADQLLPYAGLADRRTHSLARRGRADLRRQAAPASGRTRCRARAPMSGPTGCGPRRPAERSAVCLFLQHPGWMLATTHSAVLPHNPLLTDEGGSSMTQPTAQLRGSCGALCVREAPRAQTDCIRSQS